MAHRVPITVRLENFEGPLDLLLYLIQSHELDISKVSLTRITDQYLAYVRLMQELNFDVASEFLVMAATLIHWKSKAILPQEVDPNALANQDEDGALTPEQLIRQLLEHQRYRAAGQDLNQLPLLHHDVFVRPVKRLPAEKVWKEMDVTQLALSFQQQLVRERKRTTVLRKETVSLSEKIVDFSRKLQLGKIIEMDALLDDLKSRPERVVTFLASLELSRLRRMKVYQQAAYEKIYVELIQTLAGFDLSLASGFDAVAEAGSSPAGGPGPTQDAKQGFQPGDGTGDFTFSAPVPGAEAPGTSPAV